jgi:hypothetical protein
MFSVQVEALRYNIDEVAPKTSNVFSRCQPITQNVNETVVFIMDDRGKPCKHPSGTAYDFHSLSDHQSIST